MTTALLKASSLVAMPTNDSGEVDEANPRRLEVSGAPDFSDSFDTIERNVVRKSFSTYAPLRGLESTSATITLELHGSGLYNQAPESALLYKSVFGELVAPTSGASWEQVGSTFATNATSVSTASTTKVGTTSPAIYRQVVVLDSVTGLKVGYPLRFSDSSTHAIKTIGFIDKIDGFNVSILTQNPVTISTSDDIDCGYLFLLKKLNDEQVLKTPEVNIDYYRGNITREGWTGFSATSFEIDFSTGQVCLPSFSFEGAEVGYSDESDGGDYEYAPGNYTTAPNLTFDSERTSPLVVQLTDIFMQEKPAAGSTSDSFFQECISNIQFSITNEVYKKQCIATLGVGEVLRTSRAVTGSLNTFYTSKAFSQAFRENTKYRLMGLFNYAKGLLANGDKDFNTEAGNIVAVSAPQLQFSDVSVSEDSGIFKYDSSFSCEPIEGDDELLLAFL